MNDKEYDFVKRTQMNLKRISSIISSRQTIESNEPVKFYHVTNLINSCLGLVSYVFQYAEDEAFSRYQSNSTIDLNNLTGDVLKEIFQNIHFNANEYGNVEKCLPKWGNNNISSTDIAAIVYRMRNAICHNNIAFTSREHRNGKKYIESVHFNSKSKDGRSDVFRATMTIKQLKKFVLDVSEAYLEYYNTHNINNKI